MSGGNNYQPVSERGRALYGDEIFDAEFTAAEEADLVAAGHIEIAPRPYKVLSRNFAAAPQGETVELALPVEAEAALIAGGHIERAKRPAAPKKAAAKKK